MTSKAAISTAAVEKLLDKIRPSLEADGGSVELVGIDAKRGVVTVRLQGACATCPFSAMTLKHGIERFLKAKMPAVKEVVAVD